QDRPQSAAAQDQYGGGPRRRFGPLRRAARYGVRLRVHPEPGRDHGLARVPAAKLSSHGSTIPSPVPYNQDMTGRLHQLHVEYAPADARILLKFNTVDRQELRCWLTRKFVKSFWDSLQTLLAGLGRAGTQSDPVLKKAMVGFEQECAAPRERFAKSFAEDPA